jgi:hypothetical protein
MSSQPACDVAGGGDHRRGLEPLVGHLGVLRPDGVPFRLLRRPEHPVEPAYGASSSAAAVVQD